MTIVGGTYDEYCFEPRWKNRFGSGLRACTVINSLSPPTQIDFHTFCDKSTVDYLTLLPFLRAHPTLINHTIQFHYDHPLSNPAIAPRLDTIDRSTNKITAKDENILFYGFVEGFATVTANKVVYDPQSPINPLSVHKTNSTAKELTYVINIYEARILSGENTIEGIKKYFFETEKASVIVLKMGAKGALVVEKNGQETRIPVYKTDYVWPIGSGDVFAATFAYYWFENGDPVNAAQQASWQTACYCNSKRIEFSEIGSIKGIEPLVIENFPKGLVYLAGPFFTFAERWLVNQIRTALLGSHLNVFSPWHDVGHGVAAEVVSKDLDALDKAQIVFAVVDGLDSGTLFEIGYAIKSNIPVIAYVENETLEAVKMLEGTNCILEKDLTTAIYKCFWKLSEKENA